jgi:hypothetical protein
MLPTRTYGAGTGEQSLRSWILNAVMGEGCSWKHSSTTFASSALAVGHSAQTRPEPVERVFTFRYY